MRIFCPAIESLLLPIAVLLAGERRVRPELIRFGPSGMGGGAHRRVPGSSPPPVGGPRGGAPRVRPEPRRVGPRGVGGGAPRGVPGSSSPGGGGGRGSRRR